MLIRAHLVIVSLRSKRFRSIGLSAAGLKHFSLFERTKIERSFHQCCARPNFRAAKKRNMPRTSGKTSETLATQARC